MKLSTRIRYGLARALVKGAAFPIVPEWVRYSFLDPTFASLTKEGYQKNAAFFACVSALAFAFPEPPLLVYTEEGEAGQVLPKHPLRKLLKKPNPLMGEREMAVYTMVYMAIGGACRWHKVRNRAGQVVELWPYHAGQMVPIPGGPTWIDHYVFDIYGTGGQSPGLPQIDAADVVDLKWPSPDPTQPWQPQPPLMAAAREVDTDNEATRYLFALLKNDAIPRTVLEVPSGGILNDDQIRRMKAQFRERYGGDQRGDVAIIEGGAKVSRLSLNLEELAFEALHKMPEARIAAVMRVPPILAGLNVGLDRSTFSNYGEARKALAQDTLAPLWAIVGDEVEADLGSEFGGVAVHHDLSRVQALQEETVAKWRRIGQAYKDGLIQKNEGRRAIGYPDVPDGDTFVSTTTPASQLAEPAKRALSAPQFKARPQLDTIETRIERAVQVYLSEQYEKAAAGVAA